MFEPKERFGISPLDFGSLCVCVYQCMFLGQPALQGLRGLLGFPLPLLRRGALRVAGRKQVSPQFFPSPFQGEPMRQRVAMD